MLRAGCPCQSELSMQTGAEREGALRHRAVSTGFLLQESPPSQVGKD